MNGELDQDQDILRAAQLCTQGYLLFKFMAVFHEALLPITLLRSKEDPGLEFGNIFAVKCRK